MDDKELRDKAIKAARDYLVRKGYSIKHANCIEWADEGAENFDIVAISGESEELVFVYVDVANGEFPEIAVTHEEAEKAMIRFFLANPEGDYLERSIRFDTIAMCVTGKDSALLKHEIRLFSRDYSD